MDTEQQTLFQDTETVLTDRILTLETEHPGYSFSVGKLGAWMVEGRQCSPFWGSIFVCNPTGEQIGRLIFANGLFSHHKEYAASRRSSDPHYVPDPFWGRIEKWQKTLKTTD